MPVIEKEISLVPVPLARALRKLGQDLRDARRRRRIPMDILAQRSSTTRATLRKIEHGDPTVSLRHYAMVLFAFGLVDRLGDLADPRHDAVGLELEEEHLPERIRLSRKKHKGRV